ncbi:ABC transporter ATP-binding protein [Pelovirga terrestris]|uniref:ATP-binding cassette domain-containing protein n=1 Tax=Pelovirga terrestris TaxID=2771352 RepID=A0A8J6R602_9BACT|nr:ATP-binding cassette domain-containing protein [Pelovirga terrestris]MBD1400839.1 ATP-binding cassette domain-containing protein [Pelovirga terrestris]
MNKKAPKKSLTSTDYFIEVRHLTKKFGAFTALDNVNIGVKPGEFVSILGPSGCGKTTLLRVIAGLEQQNSGSVWIQGNDVSREPVANRQLGIVFQSYALFPNINIINNVQYGLRQMTAPARRERAQEMLELVGLSDQADKYPAQLSGGQQQRVALARALAPNPSLLLLDEPLSALDARVRARLRGEIRSIQEKLGVTTIMVTHDQEEALTMADRIVVMDQGQLMQFADPQQLYGAPANTFVAGFIGTMNFLPDCRHQDTTTVRFLDYSLESRPPEGFSAPEQITTLAIRPEHVRIADDQDRSSNILRARIEQIEFRGSVSRVMVRVLHLAGHPSAHQIEIDLQPKAVDQLQLDARHDLDIYLPPKHVLAFSDSLSLGAGQSHAA